MKAFIFSMALCLVVAAPASALTFKKGEVLGSDGKMHQGASPEQTQRLIANAEESGDVGGVVGNNVFVVVGEGVTFIPINDLRNLPKETQIDVIGNAVVQTRQAMMMSPTNRSALSVKFPKRPASASRTS